MLKSKGNSQMPDIKALYTDRDIIIVEKQPGMSSEIDDNETDAPTAVGKLCGCTCYPVHRLDKGTGGVLVLAKNERAAAMLSAVFSQHKALSRRSFGDTGSDKG